MDTLTIERLKSGDGVTNFNERADDIMALLAAAAEMVQNSKSKTLLTLRGTRMREEKQILE